MKADQLLMVTVASALLCAGAVASDDLDSLFDLDAPIDGAGESTPTVGGSGIRFGGYGEFSAAYSRDPDRWSKLRTRFELAATGRLGGGPRFKLAARADLDAAYDVESNHYPRSVKHDQRRDFSIREAYLDFGAGEWEFRLGRQHVVWGEMVGLFLADVVSARDLREFVLPEFEAMRIPQWAARAEYFAGETHFEFLWIPVPSYDDIGKPGADFYPFPVPGDVRVRSAEPSTKISDTNWGLRVSHLIDGWDLTGFYYQSRDVAPTLYRTLTPTGPRFELRNDRIKQIGGTFSKDYGRFVLKGEAVHTAGRKFNSADPSAPFGLKASNVLDYVVGADIPTGDWRVNLQFYGRHAFDHERSFGFDGHETGYTMLVNRRFGDRFEAEVLYVSSLNRSDYMLRPKVIWNISQEWRGQLGADLFGGRDQGLFGRFDDSDRVYVEVRRWF